MFSLSFVNVDTGVRSFDTFAQAIAEARRCGFEAIIQNDNGAGFVVASFSPISGLRVTSGICRECGEPNDDTGTQLCDVCIEETADEAEDSEADESMGYPGVDCLGISGPVDIDTITEYGITARLSRSIRVF
jgi:hypothetical protein